MRGLAPCLMVQGTGSSVGKSVIATALCRIFARRGLVVAPFKSQNMALNAAVAADGGEIGRAQAAQAAAAGVAPSVDMNPILLKPEAGQRSQVVVLGRVAATVDYRAYQRMKPELLEVVAGSLARLRRAHDLVVIEGAGSPAEINLAADELVNMRVARLADARVLLVGDIDRGGVFAAFVGTLALLDPADRARVAGFVVNKFRGDRALLEPGLAEIAARTGVPVLGVVPMLADTLVPSEDSQEVRDRGAGPGDAVVDVAVVRLPQLANFDDFEPLAREPGVRVRYVTSPAGLVDTDLAVVPGSKSTLADLAWLRERRLAEALVSRAAAGRPVLGVCGGYQMLGRVLRDPDGVEAARGSTTAGLGLLDAETVFAAGKRTVPLSGRVRRDAGFLAAAAGLAVSGYEIHAGRTARGPGVAGVLDVSARGPGAGDVEGAVGAGGAVVGTYCHGLFESGPVRRALLEGLAARTGRAPDPRWGREVSGPARFDPLADAVEGACDMAALEGLAGVGAAAREVAELRAGGPR